MTKRAAILLGAFLLGIAGCGSSHQATTGYFNMRALAEAVAQENVENGNAALPSRHEELCIRTGKQTAECQFPVFPNIDQNGEGKPEFGPPKKRTVKVTISSDGKSYIAH